MENFNSQEVAERIMAAVQNEYKNLKTLNVMVLGKTGVGKSTLINNMFNQNMVETGVGRPVTQKIRKITKPNFPLAIYDTPGLELQGDNASEELLKEVTYEIKKGFDSRDISETIHCIWYCVSTPSHRFEQAEIDSLKKLLNGATKECNVPVIIILTQSYSDNDAQSLKKEIEKENLPVVNIVPVLADDYVIGGYTVPAYGLNSLSVIMSNVIPESVEKTFVAVQKVNLELKKGRAQTVVATSAAAAATIGAVPIPFSDAAALVPEQMAMLAGITAVFGIPIEKATITAIVSATIGTTGTTVLGRSVVTNLLKLIPGAGSVVGGAISAATAAALTTALGEAYISIMVMICKGELSAAELSTEKGKMEVKRIFTERMKLRRNEKGEVIE